MQYVGPEIPTLNEGWSFFGAKLDEWLAGAGFGFFYIVVVQTFIRPPKGIDGVIILILTVGLTYTLRLLREKYPDEKRGLVNKACDIIGLPPPLIPKPASFCKFWSGNRVSSIKGTEFYRLKFHEFLLVKQRGKV
ncbi:MAG: hypothetical protein NZT61_02225 [Deltaproteobacteria bacterium]|nr:hypothetical protein [Deltaproteobacteria bacterium]MCX7953112.1 hypothetical protein [Deltaproteobacteria bacterium]